MNRNIEKNTNQKRQDIRFLKKWTDVIDKVDDLDDWIADYLMGDTREKRIERIQENLNSTQKALEDFTNSFNRRVKKGKKQE